MTDSERLEAIRKCVENVLVYLRDAPNAEMDRASVKKMAETIKEMAGEKAL